MVAFLYIENRRKKEQGIFYTNVWNFKVVDNIYENEKRGKITSLDFI
jgi:hypothetical protein